MRKIIILVTIILSLSTILITCFKGSSKLITSDRSIVYKKDYITLFNKIDRRLIEQIIVENVGTERMKKVTKPKDIVNIINKINMLRFKDINNDESKKPQRSGNSETINYRIIVTNPNYIQDDIILNINKSNIFYRGKWYIANFNIEEEYISSLYKNLNYEELSTIM